MNRLVVGCWLLVVGALLLGCSSEADSERQDTFISFDMVDAETGEDDDLILQSGEQIRLELDETAPEDVEENPLLTITLFLQDEATGKPVMGDVFLYQKLPHESLDVVAMLPMIPCEGVHVCFLQDIPPLADGHVWLIQVRAEGYQDWALEMNFNSKSSRTMELPVKLKREAVGILG